MPKTKLIKNKRIKKVSAVLSIKDKTLLEDLEELDAIRAYDAAKASCEKPIPFENAVEEIERSRK